MEASIFASAVVDGAPELGLRRRSAIGASDAAVASSTRSATPAGGAGAPQVEKESSDRERRELAERAFECNVCLELAHDPVVTICGHLHCWPCLYRWKLAKESNECPVCKAQLTDDKIIPLYGRGMHAKDPRKNQLEGVPQRPAAQRPPSAPQPGVGNLGMLPLLGMMPAGGAGSHSALLYGEPVGTDSQQQAFLSRLLLMLGSFVILCLLVF